VFGMGTGVTRGAVARPSGRAYHPASRRCFQSMRDFDDNAFPLAYLITFRFTFRCYGTWLHGDPSGSMDRKHNTYGTPKIELNPQLETSDAIQITHQSMCLDARERQVFEHAVKEVCDYRSFILELSMCELTTCILWLLLCLNRNRF
jgi:hypothetical protein